MPNNPTTKFKVDISELKSKIQQANRLIRLNNSEFKATTASMTDWSKSADGVSAKIKQLTGNIEQEKKKLESLEEQYRLTAKEQGEDSKGAQDLLIKINNQRAAIAKDEAQIKSYNEKLREMTGQENDTRTATDKLSDEINQQKDDLQQLKKKYADVVLEEGRNSESAQTLKNDIKKLSDKLYENKAKLDSAREAADKLDSSLDDVSDASNDAADNGISSMNVALGNLAAEGISKVAGKLKEIAEETIAAGANFEAGMSNVAAISGANADELDKLTQKAEEMGANTKFSATEASQAFNYMAMAGWKSEDMLNGIEGIMNLAAASGEDLATTSDIVTDALTAFGLKAKDSGRFADILAQASSNANTNVSMMGETFKYVAPVAGTLGFSAEDIAVAVGLMANSGIKASQAGTTLRGALTRLSKPTKEMETAMVKLGIATSKSVDAVNKTKLDKAQTNVLNKTNALKKAQIAYDEALKKSGDNTQVQKAANSLSRAQIDYSAAVKKSGENSDEAKKAFSRLNDATLNYNSALDKASSSSETAKKAYLSLQTAQNNLTQAQNDLKREQSGTIHNTIVEGNLLTDSKGKMRSFADVMDILRDKFSKFDKKQQASIATSLFGKQSMSGMLAVINAAPKDYKKLTKSIKNADGASKKMSKTMQDNLQGEMTSLNSKIESIQIELYKKFSPALKKGVQELKKFADSKEAQDMLDDLGDDLGELATDAVKFIKWALTNADKIIPIVKGIGKELLIIFTANKVNSFTTQVGSLISSFRTLTTATEGATTAQKLLNIAENSNPIGIVITIIGTLVTAYQTLTAVMGDTEDEAKELDLSPNAQEAKKEVDDVKKSYDEVAKARDNAVKDKKSEWEYYEKLWKELKSIVDENGKIKKGYEDRVKFITGELKDATGKEIEIADGAIQKYDELKKSIERVMQAQRAKAILSANEDAYNAAIRATGSSGEATQAIVSAQNAYNEDKSWYDSYTRRQKKQEELAAEAEKQMRILWTAEGKRTGTEYLAQEEKYKKATHKAREYAKQAQLYRNSLKEDEKSLSKAQNVLANHKAIIENYENLSTAISSGSEKKIKDALLKIQGSFVSANAGTKTILENQVKSYEKQYNSLNAAYKNGVEGITKTTVDEAKKLWDKSVKEFEKYEKKSAEQGKKVVQAEADGMNESIPKVQQAGENVNDTIKLTMAEGAEKAYDSGQKVVESWANGVNDALQKVKVKDYLPKDVGVNGLNYGLPIAGGLIFNANNAVKSSKPGNGSTVINNYTNNSTTFNQTNNSPKPLSALDTYRNTKNLLKVRNGVK